MNPTQKSLLNYKQYRITKHVGAKLYGIFFSSSSPFFPLIF